MKNCFSECDAKALVAFYQQQNINEDIALRVYTSRLLGREPRLALHGGGNTSVKTTVVNLLGEVTEVICVKGSGWDLASIEPEGLPALKLAPLLRLRQLTELSDEAMVTFQRGQLVNPYAPNPSIETLLHAFLPHKFIDHTHANAILSLTNQPDGAAVVRHVFQDTLGIVTYIKPGFDLAQLAVTVYEQNPTVQGLVLLHHGLFTFGETAEESYSRTMDAVTRAETYIRQHSKKQHVIHTSMNFESQVPDVIPILRGVCALGLKPKQFQRMILCHRNNELIRRYVNGKAVARYSQVGVITPDHIIRTKNFPLILQPPIDAQWDVFRQQAIEAVAQYQQRYHDYFERQQQKEAESKKELDSMPRIILIPGMGLFALGKTSSEANSHADIAEHTMETILDAESMGTYTALDEANLFAIEYWSLEQAKLSKQAEKPFSRQVVVITGSAGTIGAATAKAFAHLGAEIVLLDIRYDVCLEIAKSISAHAIAIGCDITHPESVRNAFRKIASALGGVDIVIFNAGSAFQGKIGEVSEAVLRQSFEINFFAHQWVAQQAIDIMKKQRTGGSLLFNVSKQAINPGPDFGPYGIAKAATLALMRQYAIDHADIGIRANAVNADRVRSGLLTEKVISERAKARGMTVETYLCGNLLGLEVSAEDVAQAFVHQALAHKTTAAITTVDGGNIAAAVR
ncbi:MAG: short-chain dehydrogenase [Coxiella sp. RIFCSPHIGHO2_12_FULL_44_14]|nr:MAG: short-chain dehydrogenase [Coxiella sp. RIFCSPHIGHO2_12_FULL_44_14]